jgi:hypothetical protein
METQYYSPYLTALFVSRRVCSGIPTSTITRGVVDRIPHCPNESSTHESHAFDLKKVGAISTVRIVVRGALGILDAVDMTIWCFLALVEGVQAS